MIVSIVLVNVSIVLVIASIVLVIGSIVLVIVSIVLVIVYTVLVTVFIVLVIVSIALMTVSIVLVIVSIVLVIVSINQSTAVHTKTKIKRAPWSCAQGASYCQCGGVTDNVCELLLMCASYCQRVWVAAVVRYC